MEAFGGGSDVRFAFGGSRESCQPCGQQWLSCNKNSDHRDSGEHPCLAVFHAYCHTLWLGGGTTVHDSMKRGAWNLHTGPLLDSALGFSSSGGFNLYSFSVINGNHEYNSFQPLRESLQCIITLKGGFGNPSNLNWCCKWGFPDLTFGLNFHSMKTRRHENESW